MKLSQLVGLSSDAAAVPHQLLHLTLHGRNDLGNELAIVDLKTSPTHHCRVSCSKAS